MTEAQRTILDHATREGCLLTTPEGFPQPYREELKKVFPMMGTEERAHPSYFINPEGRIQSNPPLKDLPWECFRPEPGRVIIELYTFPLDAMLAARACNEPSLAEALSRQWVGDVLMDSLGLERDHTLSIAKVAFYLHLDGVTVEAPEVEAVREQILKQFPGLRSLTDEVRQEVRERVTQIWLNLAAQATKTPGCKLVAFCGSEPVIECEEALAKSASGTLNAYLQEQTSG